MSNADIAHQLTGVAQLLSARGENPYKIKAYRRAADTIQTLGESLSEIVRQGGDLTQFAGIGKGIAGAVTEIVHSGGLRKLDQLRTEVPPEIAALNEFPRLDPKRVQQVYAKLGIKSVPELRHALERGDIGRQLGPRIEHHVRHALVTSAEVLLFDADAMLPEIRRYLLEQCGAERAEPAGDLRRRVEVIRELHFLVATSDFERLVERFQQYGGRSERVDAPDQPRVELASRAQRGSSEIQRATFRLPAGILLTVEVAPKSRWGTALLLATGSESHLTALEASCAEFGLLAAGEMGAATERAAYRHLRLEWIPPELREGRDEVQLAATKRLPRLVALDDLVGDLHLHTTASDGAHTLGQMVDAARERGYAYLGIADHSQSLRIAGGLSEADAWEQIRQIDRLNARLRGFRVLKSAEVDILVDGTLDYPDALLREFDYVVCSIHSRFGLTREKQTERILRAMDHPCFSILGHATGRLLLRRPGYDIDVERIIRHAKERGCFFEINASPDRLDLSAAHARLAREAGLPIAINTDAHSVHELEFMRCGVDVARRAGYSASEVMNTLPAERLLELLHARRRR